MTTLAPIPSPNAPLVETHIGRIKRDWFLWLTGLFASVQSSLKLLRRTVAHNTAGIGTAATVRVGTLPRGAILMPGTGVRITTAFSGGTIGQLHVGTGALPAVFVSNADVVEGVAGWYPAPATTIGYVAIQDTPVYVRYTGSGNSAGEAVVVLVYAPAQETA